MATGLGILLSVEILWEPNCRVPDLISRPRQSGRQTIIWVPTLGRLQNYHFVPGSQRILAFLQDAVGLFFFSFVILMNNLSSKSPVTHKGKKHERRNYSWKMVVWIFHMPYPFSPAPLAFLRRMSLDLNSPDILITG